MKTFQKLYSQYGYRIVEVILALVILLLVLTVYRGIKQDKFNEQMIKRVNELSKK